MNQGPILVTGAGGFVCSEIAVALAGNGAEVIALDKDFDAEAARRLKGTRLVEEDIRHGLPGGFGPVATVIHGAAITATPERLGISRANHIRRNMDMLTAMLDFAQGSGAGQFLFLSSMGVFDPHDGPHGGRFTEATLPTATCTYCAAKRAGELLTASAAGPGLKTISLRLGNIYGPHESLRETRQRLCLVSRMLDEVRTKSVISLNTPDAQREWSWLPDLAAAIAMLIEDFPGGGPQVLHAGTPPVITDLGLARLIAARVSGTTIRLVGPPHDAIRPPMGSDFPSIFETVAWTGLEGALDRLIPAEVTT